MKYKTKKIIPGIQLGSIYYTDNPEKGIPFTIMTNTEITLNHFFRHHRDEYFEEVKETPKPKFVVGEYVTGEYLTCEYESGEKKYINISEIHLDAEGNYEYSRYFSEKYFRDPTPEELTTYFK